MNGRTAKRLLLALLLCLQLGAGLPATGLQAAGHGAPMAGSPHCAHAMHGSGAAGHLAGHATSHAGCCVEAGCSCACLVATIAPRPTLFAAAILQAIPVPLSMGALSRRIDATLRPPI
jgi:hypothetical protein